MSSNLLRAGRIVRTQQELNAILLAHERFLLHKAGGATAQLSAMDLSKLNFAQRNLSDIDLSGATLRGAVLARTNLERASLYCADLRLADLRHACLAAADMRGTSLRGANLSCANLDNANLRSATMARPGAEPVMGTEKGAGERAQTTGVDFSNCSLKRASFNGASLEGANFSGAMMQGADFKGAKLVDVSFKDAVLTGVNLSDLKVAPEALKGAVTDPSTERVARAEQLKAMVDVHYQWIRTGGREGQPANFDGEDLRPLQSFLAGRHLTGLTARNAIAIGVSFAGCQLQGARFEGADLRDADFSDSDVRAASFRGARLTHARFSKANLRALKLVDGREQSVDLWQALALAEQFSGAELDCRLEDLGLRSMDAEAAA
ncbi:MAG TPA: pentapeptide repeat-containing protein [Rhizomicrobium sp.]|nr:pentapeptide repeat-containing protein [Rhizomicrobium sp.]